MSNQEQLWNCDPGELAGLIDSIEMAVSGNVRRAYEHVFETGVLWLDVDTGVVGLEFTDESFEFRKCFTANDVKFCGIDSREDVAAAVAFLESLIALVKANVEPIVVSSGLDHGAA